MKRVVAGTPIDRIVLGVAIQIIVAGATSQRVGTGIALQRHVDGQSRCVQQVIPVAADHRDRGREERIDSGQCQRVVAIFGQNGQRSRGCGKFDQRAGRDARQLRDAVAGRRVVGKRDDVRCRRELVNAIRDGQLVDDGRRHRLIVEDGNRRADLHRDLAARRIEKLMRHAVEDAAGQCQLIARTARSAAVEGRTARRNRVAVREIERHGIVSRCSRHHERSTRDRLRDDDRTGGVVDDDDIRSIERDRHIVCSRRERDHRRLQLESTNIRLSGPVVVGVNRSRHKALIVGRRSRRCIRINGWAAGQQGMCEGRAAVVFQRPQMWIEVLKVIRAKSRAARCRANQVVPLTVQWTVKVSTESSRRIQREDRASHRDHRLAKNSAPFRRCGIGRDGAVGDDCGSSNIVEQSAATIRGHVARDRRQ